MVITLIMSLPSARISEVSTVSINVAQPCQLQTLSDNHAWDTKLNNINHKAISKIKRLNITGAPTENYLDGLLSKRVRNVDIISI